jgi:predicted enzyme related to lactoylglutathione lyase
VRDPLSGGDGGFVPSRRRYVGRPEATMKLRLLNAVILAQDYEKMRDWWIEVVGLQLKQEWTDKYHYAELAVDGRFVVGIASAEEMGAKPSTPRANGVVPQLQVDDVKAFLAQIQERGGDVPLGPSFDADEKFWFGGFSDVEGNPVWVVSLPERLLDE